MRFLQRPLAIPLGLFAVGLLLSVPSVRSQTFPQRPAQGEFVLDEAILIHAGDQQQIEAVCQKLLREEQIPIVVVTIPSLAKYDGRNIESYTRALFDNWGIGSQKGNYGILLLVSVGDRKARIELGAAWAGAKGDTARMIMQDIMVPNFKKGDYSSGILQGVQALDTMARGNSVRKTGSWTPLLLVLGVVVLGVAVGVSLIRSGHAGWGWALVAFIGTMLAALYWLASRVSGGRSSSSGESYAGGSGGGGGATGSW